MKLAYWANQVLQEFGGVMPENLISFEDAQREFVAIRALALQKLGISTTDLTVTKKVITPSVRDSALSAAFGKGVIPAFVELEPSGQVDEVKFKVEILPLEMIADYEGARAIAFYGTPTRYRLSWDAWDEGDLALWYDPIEDITEIRDTTDITFPPAFFTYLTKKTAFNLIRIARTKLVMLDPIEYRANKKILLDTIKQFEVSLAGQVSEWEAEFHKYRNVDLNGQPHLRRTNDEILAGGFGNITRNSPLDLVG